MKAVKEKKRIELLIDLAHYFQAYVSLSEQIKQAANNNHVDSLIKLTDLRQQTQNQIDKLLNSNPTLLAVAIEQETDENIIKVRGHIKQLVQRSLEFNEGVLDMSVVLRDNLKKTIGNLSKGRKGMRGYTVGKDKRARFIETTK